MKIEGSGSGSISQRHGSADPDPHQNVMDPQHCFFQAHHEGGEVGAQRSVLYGDRGEQVRHQVQEQEAGSAGEYRNLKQ